MPAYLEFASAGFAPAIGATLSRTKQKIVSSQRVLKADRVRKTFSPSCSPQLGVCLMTGDPNTMISQCPRLGLHGYQTVYGESLMKNSRRNLSFDFYANLRLVCGIGSYGVFYLLQPVPPTLYYVSARPCQSRLPGHRAAQLVRWSWIE